MSVAGHSQLASDSTISASPEYQTIISRAHRDCACELKEVTERIGKGDFSTSPDLDRPDEIGQLAAVINRLQQSLLDDGNIKVSAERPSFDVVEQGAEGD